MWNRERGEEDIRRAVARVRDSQAIAASLAEARGFVARAQEALQPLPANAFRQAMHDLADFVVERRR
jgi:octaprenyl-diphosphate synthase